MRSSVYALAGSAASALAAVRGLNYGSQSNTLETFTEQFTAAQSLSGPDFSSARLYTMIQDGTTDTVISAIPAAINTNTSLLLGLWASGDTFENELTALKTAISQYGSSGLADLTKGISVGSEDLYRISVTGIAQDSGVGQSPDVLVKYIQDVRDLIAGTVLADVPVGHVDTWNVYINTSNAAVVEAVDFLGLDEYPFYQDGDGNSIDNASTLFWDAYDNVEAVADGTPIWITETGWPVSGDDEDEAVPSVANAEKYWQAIACELEARCINFWWYILIDTDSSPSFGLTDAIDGTNTESLYSLTCNVTSSCSSSSSSSSSSASSSSASKTASASSTASAGTSLHFTNGTDSDAASYSVEATVYVTDVTTSYTTTCPAGQTLTQSGSTTVLTAPSVITTTGVITTTISTSVTVVPTVVVKAVTSSVTKTLSSGATVTVTPTAAGVETITLYSTDVETVTSCASTVTDCPARSTVVSTSLVATGTTVTSEAAAASGSGLSTTVLTEASTVVYAVTEQVTVTSQVVATSSVAGAASGTGAVAGAAGASGAAAGSGTGAATGAADATTLASSWAASQTPGAAATSAYGGAGNKVGGSIALALGAAAVALL